MGHGRHSAVTTATAVVAGAVAMLLILTSSAPAGRQPRGRSLQPVTVRVQHGFAMPAYSQDGYRSPEVSGYLRQMTAVGATWVQINPTWYQDDTRSAAIAPTARTPSDTSVSHAIDLAHRAGLKVLLKPLLDVAPDGSTYRGDIRPDDRAAWFAAYTAFIGHYADLAARERVEEFALGAELAGVTDDRAGWLAVVAAVRARYGGPVLYAANFDEYAAVAFWDVLDLVGIDAYWPVSSRPTSDVRVLQSGWQPIVRALATFAVRTGRRILFAEAGYTSQHGSTTSPWSWTVSDTPDQAEQAAAYQALLASLSGQPWWAGVYWWAWAVPSGSDAEDPLDYSPRGKAAETVVRRWWT